MPSVAKALAAVAGAGAACLGWGLVERGLYTVRRVTLYVLPPGSDELRVLHVSDFHLMVAQRGKQRFIASLAGLAPDLVVNTGDNIAQASAVPALMGALEPLRGVPGVFVFGSNDYHAPHFRNPLKYLTHGASSKHGGRPTPRDLPTDELAASLESLGWVNLTQQRAVLEVGGRRLAFRGTDDAHLGRDDYAAVAGSPDADAALNIGVTHAPYLRLLDAMTRDGVDLIFAGHTHGGQVCVPGYGALITNCDLDTARAKGASTHTVGSRTAHLHVSAGLGTSPFAPYRFACRPEVTLLRLRPIRAAG
ncbi:metallophosphoesterase [Tessaracoccus lubricantis]|uniref:Metallophosphoesterase n=1 Tax=Tessaracoccus lubricantis TaxID=545543 RepID=A0ABP9F1F4_9ACTN